LLNLASEMKQKAGTKKRRKYDASFKADVLQMLSNGRPAGEVSQALGIGENLIYKWKRSHADQAAKEEPSAVGLQAENERLKAALSQAEQERDILLNALLIFSRPT
jgi:transposase